MTPLAGPFLIACIILGLSGAAKAGAPLPARRALGAVGIRVPAVAVRVLGVGEIALAAAGIFSPGPVVPILVGMAYLAFAAFVMVLLRVSSDTSCGCFGSADTPPSRLHVIANLASAGAAFGATGWDGLIDTLDGRAGTGFALMMLVLCGSYAVYLLLVRLPVLLAPPADQVRAFTLSDASDLEVLR